MRNFLSSFLFQRTFPWFRSFIYRIYTIRSSPRSFILYKLHHNTRIMADSEKAPHQDCPAPLYYIPATPHIPAVLAFPFALPCQPVVPSTVFPSLVLPPPVQLRLAFSSLLLSSFVLPCFGRLLSPLCCLVNPRKLQDCCHEILIIFQKCSCNMPLFPK
jgi:hypothetical protein